ncbi:P-loop containing nucleoside triphosphate hydrolase protein [Roridomyces roridus]|uniref:P-loop containing nucleoside triphosphate hydrolase protein n=1 Tax=Roridomyces roridus TaxID=1738132 RepID=A0AAD7C9C6_9AGAR|nr:P-loop containing nucleoside triphosphate hydrolase protein [Roridomyces roridus]
MERLKCVIVGDGGVGKSSVIFAYTTHSPDTHALPTVHLHTLELFDTVCDDGHYDRLRPLSYASTDVFLVCFKITSLTSFSNVKQNWLPELKHFSPLVPWILVGLQVDLLRGDSESRNGVNKAQGTKLAEELGAVKRAELFEQVSRVMGKTGTVRGRKKCVVG